ncbi:MAG: hypothetical protein KME60_03310 [Cyanomargarita calcarea GSE-NOS-MK-12-04C]|jgi:hypothetical protein|uniref:Bacteriophage Mx8 p63 C-terminal domain-containing protein n=1 Tax=Cyanomargarita calcarea GSE-NOS-MK-12-04C TaxID=2839659 RepID=A0A951QHE8_9CYAN|nr:hypothetical protein [Cyanomargarita calcarea GSE-NOS-MK-12-04C]
MAIDILTAVVAPVAIGHIEIEGLHTDCGRFAVSVQQAADLFQVRPDNAQRDFKRALGRDVRFVRIRIKNAESKKAENAILLDDFRKLVLKLNKKSNIVAEVLVEILCGVSLEQLFADAFDINLTKSDRQDIANRILDKACPWDLMYQKELREKGFSWYGSQFYWVYFYGWMDAEEKAKHERLNPVINGRRKDKIHQWIEPGTRDRLRDKAKELGMLIRMSQNRIQFEKNFAALYGHGYQNDLGI